MRSFVFVNRKKGKQGCQMLYIFSDQKHLNLGKFSRALKWKRLVYFMAIWKIGITAIWYIYGHLVIYVVANVFSTVLVYYVKKNLANPAGEAQKQGDQIG
jgi:hypothetical protein